MPVEELERVREAEQIKEKRCANLRCNSPDPGNSRDWHFDHNHETGKFRGILCSYCNNTIGFARENIEVLTGIIEYLKKHQTPAPE